MSIRNCLKTLRKNKRLSQEEVARRAGISLMGYIKIETGAVTPKLDTAYRIAHAIGERIEIVFPYKEAKKK